MSQLNNGNARSQRVRIGYITPRIADDNGQAIWRGLVEAAETFDVDLLCFAGGEVGHPEDVARRAVGERSAANVVYDLVDRERLDGLVIWGSSLGYYAGLEATQRFCLRYAPLPIVSIGVAMPGIPGIVLDSYGGIHAAITHLIAVHGRRRLVFIRGPATHREAQHRYRSYCDALAVHGIPLDPRLVSPPYLWVQADGTELRTSGAEAVRMFLDEREVQFDAIVAANDTLALGALTALQARGIEVPEQVALVGFDDKPAGRIVSPPLTTLQTGLQERGHRALTLLLARLAGEEPPDETWLPATLVIRRSCGCFDPVVLRAGTGLAPIAPQPDESQETHSADSGPLLSAEQRARVLAEMQREPFPVAAEFAPKDHPSRHVPQLLDAYLSDLAGGAKQAGSFLVALDGIMREIADVPEEIWAWQTAISTLREQLLPHMRGDTDTQIRAEGLWHQARVLIGERARRAQAKVGRHAEERSDRLHAIGRKLALARDVPELMDILASELPLLGIGACAVALYEDPLDPMGQCRLVLAYDQRGRRNLPGDGEFWPAPGLASSIQFVDDRQNSIVIVPLHHRDDQLGFMMLAERPLQRDRDHGDGQIHRVLAEEICSALKSVLLLQENIRLYHAALAAQQVAQEKQALAEQADRLKSRFLSMVSHELRTPLILLEGLSEMMLRAGQTFHGDTAGSRPPLPDAYRQDLERIRATSQQLSGLVRDVLDLARSQIGQLRLTTRPLDLAAVLQPTILIGEQMARSKGLDWQVEIGPDLPLISGDGDRLQQVTLNLISNAIKFTTDGEVRLRLEAEKGGVILSVSDTGLGVPVNEQQAIFDEFRQSERTATRGYGGMGVGLAICRQIVNLHGGNIGVRSSGLEDGGSTFYYWLPVLEETQGDASGPGETAPSPDSSDALFASLVREDGSARATVLLTDRAASGDYLQAHLRDRGFEVELLPVEETDGWQSQLLALQPGAIVLDLRDATQDHGWHLVDLLKLREETRDIPIIPYSLLVEQGQGAVLTLDFLTKPMGAATLSQALWNLGLPEGSTITNATILLADDDPAILTLHRDIVAEQLPHCRILTASNGRQALELLQRGERPLVILLDLMMPELDGIGLIEAMQGDEQLRDIPVIVLTAQSLSEEDIVRLGRGVASILQKGMFTSEETLAQIERALAGNRQLHSETRRLVRRAMAYIQTNYAQDISRTQLADYVGVSPRHLTRCFSQEVGLSPIDYLNRFRVNQSRRLLDQGGMTITEVMNAVGFNDSSYFSKIFRREVGTSPRGYLRRAAGRNQPATGSQDVPIGQDQGTKLQDKPAAEE